MPLGDLLKSVGFGGGPGDKLGPSDFDVVYPEVSPTSPHGEAAVEYARHAAFAASQAESSAAYAASQSRVVASSARAALERIAKILASEQLKWWAKPEWAEPGCDHKDILQHPIVKKILLPLKMLKASGVGLDNLPRPVLASVATALALQPSAATATAGASWKPAFHGSECGLHFL
mmetsp:Transcript_64510/g.120030  ORF Transcript_64510/g.120030 Transcript_64510/m.120030 type:complete len:176 (-) Transcript_64510:11-538(-)